MRRIVGAILIGIAAFAFVAAALLEWYAYPRLAVIPLDQYATSVAEGDGMDVFYASDIEQRTGVEVVATRRVRGDVEASRALDDDSKMVWDEALVVEDASGNLINATTDRLCLDRHTAEAVTCDTEEVDGDSSVRHRGLSYKFPFDTEQKSYDYFDTRALEAYPMEYEGAEEIQGLEVYKFVQEVPETKIDELEVPGELLGRPAEPSVLADQYYETTRTVWVEPVTGIIIRGSEDQLQRLRAQQGGGDTLDVFAGTLAFNEETVRDNVADAKEAKSGLEFVGSTGPLVALIVGIVALVVGLLLLLVPSRTGGTQRRRSGTSGDETLTILRPPGDRAAG